jgi:hypothetical protein
MIPTFKQWLARRPSGRKPRKRLPQSSPKRAKALRLYRVIRKDYLAANPWCEAGAVIMVAKLPASYHVPRCSIRATEIHHLSRRGPNLNNTDTFCGCCHECHRWIETHAQEARRLGLLT